MCFHCVLGSQQSPELPAGHVPHTVPDLPGGADLVRAGHHNALLVLGGHGVQGKHVAVDDVGLHRVQSEVPLRVLHGLAGMVETVELMVIVVLPPVVEEIVVEQRAPHHAPPIHVPAPFFRQADAAKGHRHGMVKAGGTAMLGDRALLIHGRRMQNIPAVFPKHFFCGHIRSPLFCP